jgi:hypothetical protein
MQSHSTQTKRKAIAVMRRSSFDSLLTASQMDEAFGSGTSGLSEVFLKILREQREGAGALYSRVVLNS